MAEPLLLPGGIVSMTAAAADRLIRAANGDAALLYLHLLQRGGSFSPEAARQTLGWPGDRLRTAHAALVQLGLATNQTVDEPGGATPPEPDAPPEYTSADIARELEGAGAFPHLVREMERRLGKVLSSADLKTLYTIYDYLAMPAEVILMLTIWCTEEMERKYGPGRKPRMTQIRKEAFIWHRLGVDTPETADAHMRSMAALQVRERAILPVLGIGGRAPVAREREYIASWVEMGFDDASITLAYEKTVLKKGNLNWAYMNSILKSWHQKNLHTVRQIEQGDSAWRKSSPNHTQAAQPQPGRAPAPEGGQSRLKEDMDWMDRFLEQTEEKRGE